MLQLHSQLWARIILARAALTECIAPSVKQDNCRFLSLTVEMPAPVLHEMVGEFFALYQNRQVARKTGNYATPSVINLE
jgi:hypothetical protein